MTKNTRGVTISSFHLEIEREEKIPLQFRVIKKEKKEGRKDEFELSLRDHFSIVSRGTRYLYKDTLDSPLIEIQIPV